VFDDGGLLVQDGIITAAGDFARVRAAAPDVPVTDWRGSLAVPGLIDTHVHFPQLRILGRSGPSLLEWLERVALPEEARMADLHEADRTARDFVEAMLAHGTTSALVFGAHYAPATAALFERASERGLRLTTGLVCADRELRPDLHQTPAAAHADASALITRFHGRGRLRYAVTPRFAVSTSEAMLEVCQSLCREHPTVLVQTHLNEQRAEVDAVRRLFPWSADYLAVYERYGLSGRRSVFAHSVWTSDGEIERLAESGSSVAHCPGSNAALGSGLFAMRRHLSGGVHCAIGTDVGAGLGFSLLRESTLARLFQRLVPDGEPLGPAHLLYLVTAAGARALGLESQVGDFQVGKAADVVRLAPARGSALASAWARAETLEDRLAVVLALGDRHTVREVRIAGRTVHAAEGAD